MAITLRMPPSRFAADAAALLELSSRDGEDAEVIVPVVVRMPQAQRLRLITCVRAGIHAGEPWVARGWSHNFLDGRAKGVEPLRTAAVTRTRPSRGRGGRRFEGAGGQARSAAWNS